MRTILITGGAGFIGSNFVYYWLNKYPNDKLVVLDALTYAGNLNTLTPVINSGKIGFHHGCITDQHMVESLFDQYGFNTVINFAAESHVDRSISAPDQFLETNINGTHNLLKVAKKKWIDKQSVEQHRFHHISTDEVYGSLEPQQAPFKETNPYLPNSPYAASKASSDHLVRAYHETYGLNTVITNCSNNYGPFHFPEKLIPLTITNILQNKHIPIYGDGMQIRDWLHVDDHCLGIELAIKGGLAGGSYNIGGANEWHNIDIVNLICKLMNEEFSKTRDLVIKYPNAELVAKGSSEQLISYVEDRLGHDRRYAIDFGKAKSELKYTPNITFEDGIKNVIHWYLENENWWKPLI